MSDISKIQLNGQEYDIKDEELRKKVKEYLSVSNFKIENKALELLINNNLNNYDYILPFFTLFIK